MDHCYVHFAFVFTLMKRYLAVSQMLHRIVVASVIVIALKYVFGMQV